jgi:hypothetical protein
MEHIYIIDNGRPQSSHDIHFVTTPESVEVVKALTFLVFGAAASVIGVITEMTWYKPRKYFTLAQFLRAFGSSRLDSGSTYLATLKNRLVEYPECHERVISIIHEFC